MKKYLVAAALVGTSFGAQAADLAVKAYVKAPFIAPVYNWTGFYIGVNGGIGNSRDYTQLSHTFAPGSGDAASFVGGFGGVGGAQMGYNWQSGDFIGLGNLVFGVEADIQASGLRDNATAVFLNNVASGFTVNQKLDWFGTARGRVGIATGPVLSYVTGGFAYGGASTTITETAPAVAATTLSGTRTGYVFGTGVEASLGGAWTGKLEWLALNLGTQTGLVAGGNPARSEIREGIFRAGLNYRIGGVDVPAPVRNWNGLYIGGNATLASALNRSTLTGVAVNESFNLSPNGFIGGGQIGYNWQAGNWVFGLEGDYQGSTQKDSDVCQLGCVAGGATPQLAVFNQKMDWLTTGRGRLGYSVGSSLFYATGGVAYGDVKTAIAGSTGGVPFAAAFSHTKTGYAVGGGIETPFAAFGWFGRNWTSKTEYLYVDLGTTTDVVGATGLTFTTHAKEQLIRTGLNYNFNTPVVAKY